MPPKDPIMLKDINVYVDGKFLCHAKDFSQIEVKEMIQDSGNRREFSTGAVRDIADGKGRCDLLPLREMAVLFGEFRGSDTEDQVFIDIDMFMQTMEEKWLFEAIMDFVKYEHPSKCLYESLTTAILDVSKHYEEGAKKYSDRNWEKGIPLHCFIDSGIRHYIKVLRLDRDEPHDRAFIWNMLGAIWTLRNHPDLNDLPGADDIYEDNDNVTIDDLISKTIDNLNSYLKELDGQKICLE